MRTDFFVASFLTLEGERFAILRPDEIPASFFFASSFEDKVRSLTLLTEDVFRCRLGEMGLSADAVDYQLERARGLHLTVR